MRSLDIESQQLNPEDIVPSQSSLIKGLQNSKHPYNNYESISYKPPIKNQENTEKGGNESLQVNSSTYKLNMKNDQYRKQLETKNSQCYHCKNKYPFAQVCHEDCQHFVCKKCLKERIVKEIVNKKKPTCFCGRELVHNEGQHDFMNLLSEEQKKIYLRNLPSLIAEEDNLIRCLQKDCSGILTIGIKKGVLSCAVCDKKFCGECKRKEHKGKCSILDKLQFIQGQMKLGFCQKCQNVIQKSEGQNKITCTCGYKFCYICWGEFEKLSKHRECPPQSEWRKYELIESLKLRLTDDQIKKSLRQIEDKVINRDKLVPNYEINKKDISLIIIPPKAQPQIKQKTSQNKSTKTQSQIKQKEKEPSCLQKFWSCFKCLQ